MHGTPTPRTTTAGRPPSLSALVLVTALVPTAWGLTYVVTTELLPPGRPLLTAVLRSLPAGVALAAVTRRRPPERIWWVRSGVLGALNIGGFFALLFVAAYRLPGGLAATLGAIQPLLAGGLAALLLGERYPARSVRQARSASSASRCWCYAAVPRSTPSGWWPVWRVRARWPRAWSS